MNLCHRPKFDNFESTSERNALCKHDRVYLEHFKTA